MKHDLKISTETATAYQRLCDIIDGHGSLMVAYSGGVDSGLLAYVAAARLGQRALAVLALSPSLGSHERRSALEFLDAHAIPHQCIDTHEMDNPDYTANPTNRCYFCKNELFTQMNSLAAARGFTTIAYGANVDDGGDHRPGAIAADEQRVVAPLTTAGFTKDRIRELSQALGLSLWDKPAAPCLASRIPYFSEVTSQKLEQVETAEAALKAAGFPICRVRHYGREARIEVPMADHKRLQGSDVWLPLVSRVRAAGFDDVTLEGDGFRSGRLNDVPGQRSEEH